jgi:hypothetical protein
MSPGKSPVLTPDCPAADCVKLAKPRDCLPKPQAERRSALHYTNSRRHFARREWEHFGLHGPTAANTAEDCRAGRHLDWAKTDIHEAEYRPALRYARNIVFTTFKAGMLLKTQAAQVNETSSTPDVYETK